MARLCIKILLQWTTKERLEKGTCEGKCFQRKQEIETHTRIKIRKHIHNEDVVGKGFVLLRFSYRSSSAWVVSAEYQGWKWNHIPKSSQVQSVSIKCVILRSITHLIDIDNYECDWNHMDSSIVSLSVIIIWLKLSENVKGLQMVKPCIITAKIASDIEI